MESQIGHGIEKSRIKYDFWNHWSGVQGTNVRLFCPKRQIFARVGKFVGRTVMFLDTITFATKTAAHEHDAFKEQELAFYN